MCQRVKAVSQLGEQSLARSRQRKRSWMPLEQSLTAQVVQQPDLMADRRWRHPEFRRRTLKAPVSRRSFECLKGPQRKQLPHDMPG
jgi:hypothetical protein